jgi:hypothetical protein
MSILENFQDTFHYTTQKTKSGLKTAFDRITSEHTQKMALSSMVFGSALSILLFSSIFIYLVIYFTSMPIVERVETVYLDYSSNVPTAILDLSLQQNLPILMKANQRYTLGLVLQVPDSDTNLSLGNFMVSMELIGKINSLVKTRRPIHLKYKSPLLRYMTTIYNSFSLLTDRSTESQTLFVPLIQNYKEKASQPVRQIKVEIHQPLLETYQTKIKFETQFQGLAYFMYHWWLSTALFFITNIMLVEILLASYIWNVMLSIFSSDTVSMDLYEEDFKDLQGNSENENSTIYETTTTPPATTNSSPSRVSYPLPSISDDSGHEMDFEEIQDIRGYEVTPGFQATTQTSLGTGYAAPMTSYSAQKLKSSSPLHHSMQYNRSSTRIPNTSGNSNQMNGATEPPQLLTESEIDIESVSSHIADVQASTGPTELTNSSLHTTDIDIYGLLETDEEIHL